MSSKLKECGANCLAFLTDNRPLAAQTKGGALTATIKRVVLGLIATTILAAALYYLELGISSTINPFQLSLQTRMGLAAGLGATPVALVGLVITGLWAHSGYTEHHDTPCTGRTYTVTLTPKN